MIGFKFSFSIGSNFYDPIWFDLQGQTRGNWTGSPHRFASQTEKLDRLSEKNSKQGQDYPFPGVGSNQNGRPNRGLRLPLGSVI